MLQDYSLGKTSGALWLSVLNKMAKNQRDDRPNKNPKHRNQGSLPWLRVQPLLHAPFIKPDPTDNLTKQNGQNNGPFHDPIGKAQTI